VIVGIGCDLVDVARFARASARTPGFAAAVLTAEEQALAPARQAARFAAKEALAKALGAPAGLAWHDAEVRTDETGRPELVVQGSVAEACARAGAARLHLSLSHDGGFALATVVLEG
jgi:holo-[acyl-carrier protein] synthase